MIFSADTAPIAGKSIARSREDPIFEKRRDTFEDQPYTAPTDSRENFTRNSQRSARRARKEIAADLQGYVHSKYDLFFESSHMIIIQRYPNPLFKDVFDRTGKPRVRFFSERHNESLRAVPGEFTHFEHHSVFVIGPQNGEE